MNPDSEDVLEVIDVSDGEDGVNPGHDDQNGRADAGLTNTDSLVYDRQIRLWGIQAQKKIMDSKVLFLGKNGIQEECMKNLLLAGMNVTLVNEHIVSEHDVKLSFFLKPEDVGKQHSVTLCKRMSSLTLNEKRISGLNSKFFFDDNGFKFVDTELLKGFNVICVSTNDYPLHKLEYVNGTCRELGVAFFASLSCGTYGYFFTDLNKHKVLETFNKNSPSVTIEYRSLSSVLGQPKFPRRCDTVITSFFCLIMLLKTKDLGDFVDGDLDAASEKYSGKRETLRQMVDMYGREFPVSSSVLGGYLALEIRKFVTNQHETIPNFCAFDMENSSVSTAML